MAKTKIQERLFDKKGNERIFDLCTDVPPSLQELPDDEADRCKVCGEDLRYNAEITKRIALVENEEVTGWVCPECYTEFDMDNNVVVLLTKTNVQGDA